MLFTYDEMVTYLAAEGYDIDGMGFEEVDELAEIEGFEWNYKGQFEPIEGLDETEL